MANIHYMNLLEEPFLMIERGIKTVEMRLYDEKRRKLRVGDIIVFSSSGREIRAAVKGLYIYENFHALVSDFSPAELGFPESERGYIADFMLSIYGKEKIDSCKTLAIKVHLEK
jgi:ASC-1-like (ASCH) protein